MVEGNILVIIRMRMRKSLLHPKPEDCQNQSCSIKISQENSEDNLVEYLRT